MELVNLKDYILINIPETFLSILFGVVITKGKNNINFDLSFISKFLFSLIFISFGLVINRFYNSNFIMLAFSSLLIYILGFRFVWKFSTSMSILNGLLILHILMFSETLTVQPLYSFISNIAESYIFFEAKLWWSMPTRLIQILALIIILKFNFNLSNNPLFKNRFKSLSYHKKISLSILLSFLTWSIFLNANYSSVYITIMKNGISLELFKINLFGILFSTILFLIYSIVSFLRTIKYEGYKEIGDRSPEELFTLILSVSSESQREKFLKILKEYDDTNYNKEVN